jgi:predicted RNA-binding protein YlqC (UPF0109 family)
MFRVVTQVLGEHLPDDADVEAVSVSDDQSTITISTATPGRVLGKRGSTAGAINQALKASLGQQVTFLVHEVKDVPEVDLFDEDQFGDDDPLGGVREPRPPAPHQPSGSAELDLPNSGS